MGKAREYIPYRGVPTSRLKATRQLVVHENLKTFTKYSERTVQNLWGLCQLSLLCALGHYTICCYYKQILT